MSLGKTIARYRVKRGWTQAQLADHLEMHQNHVNRLENDRMKPRPATLERLAEVFGITIEDLVETAQADMPLSWAKEDPELAGLVQQIPLLDDEQKNALRSVLRSMVACQQVQLIARGRQPALR